MNPFRLGALGALMLSASAAAALAQTTPTAADEPAGGAASVVTTASGQLHGTVADGVENFFGVPYAAPPVGDLRWRAPAPVEAWDDVRPATEYGSACPQTFGLDAERIENEDCLFLNVQRPEGTEADAKLPVLVFIHGGGWRTGSGVALQSVLIMMARVKRPSEEGAVMWTQTEPPPADSPAMVT